MLLGHPCASNISNNKCPSHTWVQMTDRSSQIFNKQYKKLLRFTPKWQLQRQHRCVDKASDREDVSTAPENTVLQMCAEKHRREEKRRWPLCCKLHNQIVWWAMKDLSPIQGQLQQQIALQSQIELSFIRDAFFLQPGRKEFSNNLQASVACHLQTGNRSRLMWDNEFSGQ